MATQDWPAIHKYVRAIRNTEKRRYALIYLEYLQAGAGRFDEPQHALSYMGAQAVRLHLRQLWREQATGGA